MRCMGGRLIDLKKILTLEHNHSPFTSKNEFEIQNFKFVYFLEFIDFWDYINHFKIYAPFLPV